MVLHNPPRCARTLTTLTNPQTCPNHNHPTSPRRARTHLTTLTQPPDVSIHSPHAPKPQMWPYAHHRTHPTPRRAHSPTLKGARTPAKPSDLSAHSATPSRVRAFTEPPTSGTHHASASDAHTHLSSSAPPSSAAPRLTAANERRATRGSLSNRHYKWRGNLSLSSAASHQRHVVRKHTGYGAISM